MKLASIPLAALVAAAAAAVAHAGVPTAVPFAGRLNREGAPVIGSHTFVFRLYAVQAGGDPVWEETHTSVGVDDGLVYARLGSLADSPLSFQILDGRRLFLQITMDGTFTFEPRLPIESVPYAIHAGAADLIGGYTADDLQARVTGACPAGQSIRAIDPNGGVSCERAGVGTLTGVGTGAGLTGGGSSGAPMLAVNFAAVQARVSQACPAGQAISAIAQDGSITCERAGVGTLIGVGTGAGLTGGGTSGAPMLAVNFAAVQARVSQACPAGQAISAIAQDGSITCERAGVGTLIGVTAGAGLTGGGTSGAPTLAVNPAAVQSRVAGTCVAGEAIRAIGQDGTVTCEHDDAGVGTLIGVTAGAGLTGGGTSGAPMLAVNFAAVQARLSQACPAGQAISAIAQDGSITCERAGVGTLIGVTAGAGLTGGGTSGAPTLAVNPAAVQSRVAGTCVAGEAIRAIGQDGTVTCEHDDAGVGTLIGVTAGAGLTGGGTSGAPTLAVNPAAVQSRVAGTCAAGQAIRAVAQDGTVTCEPKATRSFLGTVPIPASYSGTPSNWVAISAAAYALDAPFTLRREYLKPGQAMQARLCAHFTDSGTDGHVKLAVRHGNNASVVYYTATLASTWSSSGIYAVSCGDWVDYSALNVCTGGFVQGTCDLALLHDQARPTVVREVYLELAAVN